jgi:hypothetical protein
VNLAELFVALKSGMILMTTNTEGKLVFKSDTDGVANGETIN